MPLSAPHGRAMTSASTHAHAPESSPTARRDILALGGRRAIAFMVDLFALQLVAQILSHRWLAVQRARIGRWGIPLGAGVLIAYFGVADSRLCSGQTVGKCVSRIRVVRRDGKPPGLCGTIARAAIAIVIYVAYEAAADVRGIEPLYAIVTLTVVAGLLVVCYLINTRTQQLAHDLATATSVVPASRPPAPITETFWRGHWPIMGAILAALVVAWMLIPQSDDNQQYVNLEALATTIGKQTDVAAASVRAKLILHRSMVARDAPSMWSVTATARAIRRLPYYELFAYHIAAQILTQYPASCSAGSIAVNTIYSYNIVIDRQDESHSYEFTPANGWIGSPTMSPSGTPVRRELFPDARAHAVAIARCKQDHRTRPRGPAGPQKRRLRLPGRAAQPTLQRIRSSSGTVPFSLTVSPMAPCKRPLQCNTLSRRTVARCWSTKASSATRVTGEVWAFDVIVAERGKAHHVFTFGIPHCVTASESRPCRLCFKAQSCLVRAPAR